MASYEERKRNLKDFKFRNIVSKISDEELIANNFERKEGVVSSATAKKDIAFFARIITEAHVGWDNFSDGVKDNFKDKIVKLYENINDKISISDLKNKINEAVSIIPDLHTYINGTKRDNIYANETLNPTVGDNIIFNPKENIEILEHGKYFPSYETSRDENKPDCWQIGKINHEGQNVLVIAIADSRPGNWDDFIDAFDKVYKNGDSFDKIIIDNRGNGGGSTSKPFKYMAEKLHGNAVDDVKDFSVRSNDISNHFLHKMYPFVEGLQTRLDVSLERIAEFEKPNSDRDEIVKIIDNSNKVYPFNPEKGFNKQIDFLFDRDTGSAAEFGISNFHNLPNVRFIGENTKGISQYSISTTNTPSGIRFQFGVGLSNYHAGNSVECHGFEPDINIKDSGKDAFDVSLNDKNIGKGKERYNSYLNSSPNHLYEDIDAKGKYEDNFIVNPWEIEKGIKKYNMEKDSKRVLSNDNTLSPSVFSIIQQKGLKDKNN